MFFQANEQHMLSSVEGPGGTSWINPSKQLVDCAIERWTGSKLRSDNTSVVTVMLDPPGPPRAQVLKTRKRELAELNRGRELPTVPGLSGSVALVTNTTQPPAASVAAPPPVPERVSPRVSPVASDDEESDVSTSSDRLSDTSPMPSTSSDRVQCNEISSSEDSPSHSRQSSEAAAASAHEPVASTSPASRPPHPAKGRPSLARELSSLQLSSPRTPTRASTRSHLSSNSSSKPPRVVAKKTPHTPRSLKKSAKKRVPTKTSVHQRVKNIEQKINLIEQKVTTRTAQIAQVKHLPTKRSTRLPVTSDSSDTDSELSPKALRSRTPVSIKTKPHTPTPSKRKRTATPKREIHTRKSPRTVLTTLPKVTHSKQAKVLKLKKR